MPDEQAAQGQPSVSAAGTPPAKGKGAGKGAETPAGKEFVNRFGLPTATALVVGSIIGTGVFALPSALAATVLASGLTVFGYTHFKTVFTDVVLLSVLTAVIPYLYSAGAHLYWLTVRGKTVSWPHLIRDVAVTVVALVFSFWALAGTGYQAVYYGILAFFLGIPVYIWMKAQRREYGESPVTPIVYPAGSPYSAAVPGGTAGNGHGAGNGHKASGNGHEAAAITATATGQQAGDPREQS